MKIHGTEYKSTFGSKQKKTVLDTNSGEEKNTATKREPQKKIISILSEYNNKDLDFW